MNLLPQAAYLLLEIDLSTYTEKEGTSLNSHISKLRVSTPDVREDQEKIKT